MANGAPAGKKSRSAAAIAETATNGNGLRTVQSHGLELTVPVKIPFAVLRYLEHQPPGPPEIVGILKTILRPSEQIEKVWAADLSIEEGGDLVKDLIEAGGVDVGESLASQDS